MIFAKLLEGVFVEVCVYQALLDLLKKKTREIDIFIDNLVKDMGG